MPVVKIGTSRQVVIPKKVYDELKLASGDYLDVELRGHQLILTPKELVDKRLAEGLDDIRRGRSIGPFKTATSALKALKRKTR
jgi:AbrB family looped-hinge helix DNA binding protein